MGAPEMLKLLLSYEVENKRDWIDYWDTWEPSNTVDRTNFAPGPDTSPHRMIRKASALHYACMSGNVESIEALIKAGVDVTDKCSQGRIPQDYIEDESGEMLKEFDRFVRERNQGNGRMDLGRFPMSSSDDSDDDSDDDGLHNPEENSEDTAPEAETNLYTSGVYHTSHGLHQTDNLVQNRIHRGNHW